PPPACPAGRPPLSVVQVSGWADLHLIYCWEHSPCWSPGDPPRGCVRRERGKEKRDGRRS
ncbi:unnamed protein product, partial [Ectocarpus sp. 12 AP-2014]